MTTIYELLRSLGAGRRYAGTAIVISAVKYAMEDETRLYSVSQRLYPLVAKELSCKESSMERNIRTVIKHVWQAAPKRLNEIAGYELTQPPTVKEFLDILVTYLLHEQERKKE